jgi:hypothetical protein
VINSHLRYHCATPELRGDKSIEIVC